MGNDTASVPKHLLRFITNLIATAVIVACVVLILLALTQAIAHAQDVACPQTAAGPQCPSITIDPGPGGATTTLYWTNPATTYVTETYSAPASVAVLGRTVGQGCYERGGHLAWIGAGSPEVHYFEPLVAVVPPAPRWPITATPTTLMLDCPAGYGSFPGQIVVTLVALKGGPPSTPPAKPVPAPSAHRASSAATTTAKHPTASTAAAPTPTAGSSSTPGPTYVTPSPSNSPSYVASTISSPEAPVTPTAHSTTHHHRSLWPWLVLVGVLIVVGLIVFKLYDMGVIAPPRRY